MTSGADWSARVGATWAAEWRRTERAFADVARVLDEAIVAVAPDFGRAADVGCGVGSTTLALAAARPGLDVTGIDLAAPLAAIARERAAALARDTKTGHDGDRRVDFLVGDATAVLPPLAPLDLIVSRHGVMFFDDPVTSFAAMARAARPGASLVFSCFRAREENDWATALDAAVGVSPRSTDAYAPGPSGLADHALTQNVLAAAGWLDATATRHDVRYVVGAGDDPIADALAFFRCIGPAASALAAATPDERAAIERRIVAALAARICDGTVAFTAAIWIWVARAGEPS
ncbi:class I SAM-dependent methyltransferase [Sphingomonas sp. BK069]|uniref:class I SAM-dependent methyltransferase n=1 Tax=Sphingomonas sp. BK069 TaxID=2586979 RepID=UPI001607D08F|nr:class I SAM-dependent methyltransferase [Sphingomonas sp. BK069]MBB3346396.1 SAM-dependent methyltransferase [Sphingomonas sp. BK069]